MPEYNPNTKPVLVTGGSGFIGANVVRLLLAKSYPVRVLDDLSNSRRASVRGLPIDFVLGDVADMDVAIAAARDCSAVVHLAAKTSVVLSVEDPEPTFTSNALGTLVQLRASLAAGVTRFVFASSNAAVGPQNPPVNENNLPKPSSPYGASKLAGEAYCHAFHQSYGLKTAILRFSNAYGPYMAQKDSVIPRFIRAAMGGEDLVIYGDGTQSRDFIHAHDVAQGVIATLEHPSADGVFQIATGRETSIAELARLIIDRCRSKSSVSFGNPRRGEILRNFSDISRARRELAFDPKVGLPDGLINTIEWLSTAEETT